MPNCRKFCSINLKYAQDVEYYGCMGSNRYKLRNSILIQYVCICLIFSYSSVSFAYSSSNHSGKILYCRALRNCYLISKTDFWAWYHGGTSDRSSGRPVYTGGRTFQQNALLLTAQKILPNCRKFCSINLKYAQDVEYYGCMRSNRYKRRNSFLIQYVCICLIFSDISFVFCIFMFKPCWEESLL